MRMWKKGVFYFQTLWSVGWHRTTHPEPGILNMKTAARSRLYTHAIRRIFLFALPLALCMTILFPAISEAHAILLRSNPAQDSVLSSAPNQVQMWFTEDLNPTFSCAIIINASSASATTSPSAPSSNKCAAGLLTTTGQRIDKNDSHVSASATTEMDVSLQSNQGAGVYIVEYQTQSADDGHVLRGSFIFKVAAPDGTVPSLQGALPGQNQSGSVSSTGAGTGQIDGPTFFSFLMVTLVELSVIFWVGAQLWRAFVLQLTESYSPEQGAIDREADSRFERLFSLPVLLVLCLANIGVLIGQGLQLYSGNWGQALTPSFLIGLVSSGRFGTYWMMREIVTILGIALSLYSVILLRAGRRPRIIDTVFPWANLILGLALLIAVTLSGHAAAVSSNLLVYSVLGDWLHLLAASLWVGGMLYLAAVYLPVLQGRSLQERTRALLTALPQFSPLAIAGVIIMAVTGPFNAVVHIDSLNQLITTAYGRALLVKSVFVGFLLLTSAIHVGILRPRLRKSFARYELAGEHISEAEYLVDGETLSEQELAPEQAEEKNLSKDRFAQDSLKAELAEKPLQKTTSTELAEKPLQEKPDEINMQESRSEVINTSEHRQLETSVAAQTTRLTRILRWEPLLGVIVIICVGLMNVFAGTLQPASANQPQQTQQQPAVAPVKPFNATVQTSDKLYTVKVTITPARFGANVFEASVFDSKGKQDSNVGVSIYTTMLDMDMGTNAVNLQPDGKGSFSTNADLDMPGNWQLRIEVRTPDNKLHETTIRMVAAYQ